MPFLGFQTLEFRDLFRHEGLLQLQREFEAVLAEADRALFDAYLSYLKNDRAYPAPEESALLLKVAPHVERFLAERFHVAFEVKELNHATHKEDRRFRFKREIVTRRVRMKRKREDYVSGDPAMLGALFDAVHAALRAAGHGHEPLTHDEAAVAELTLDVWDVMLPLSQVKEGEAPTPEVSERATALAQRLGKAKTALQNVGVDLSASPAAWSSTLLDVLERMVAYRLWHEDESRPAQNWVSRRAPLEVDFEHLVHAERPRAELAEALDFSEPRWRERPGFRLTDDRGGRLPVLDEVHYCIYCHPREKDSCSKGFLQKDGTYKKNPLGVSLEGCPLEEKISETHVMRRDGHSIAALAMVMVDNPMCPGTGHRICNDCMKGCIYQKQSPVNIPLVETHTLTDVLAMPYGVEIYGLLTRWNPLNRKRPVALPYNGKNVLVVGLGPAGYTLTHYLLNEGFGVVAVDGAKLEPLPEHFLREPIRDYGALREELDERSVLGFGGVSEYGITVRWDKNFLTLMYLSLLRRETLQVQGGVRFGGTLSLDDTWALGFDHVAIAAGAGRPTMIDVKYNVARGMRQASDFLMALQLTGAFKRDALANLQVRLPALVIGGGLTAIDTATELLAYYVVQVERALDRHEALLEVKSEADILSAFDDEERDIYRELLAHGRALREERERASIEDRPARIVALLKSWGGVRLVYRKTLKDSPAYRLNHEEIEKCLEEGVEIVECMNPREALVDAYGAVKGMVFERVHVENGKFSDSGERVTLPARTVCVAAGTVPNTMYEKEYADTFQLDDKKSYFRNFRAVFDDSGALRVEETRDGFGFFTSYLKNGRTVSYYGDNHPRYAGSVVKAMASAKDGYPQVRALFERDIAKLAPEKQSERDAEWHRFASRIRSELDATVVRVDRLTDTIVEVVVRAPLAARKFEPGQFYRLQNFEAQAPKAGATPLVMEGLALTGAWTDRERGLLSLIVLEMGGSSRLCMLLRPGEPVVVMGPTGTPTEIPKNEDVVLVGGGLGNAVLFSIAKAMKDNGCRVLYFAGYKKGQDLFKQEEIERFTDQVVWCTDAGAEIAPRRPQDRHFRGNIVRGMVALASGELGAPTFPMANAKRFIVIGSDRMMAAVARARHEILAKHCAKDHVAIGSINSPMQCMMKEICAQCLQRHVDPETGKESFVFSCFNQDQLLDWVDWSHLNTRLRQNSVQEKQTALWLDRLIAEHSRAEMP